MQDSALTLWNAEADDVAVLETVVDPDCETLDVAVPESVDVAVDDNDDD